MLRLEFLRIRSATGCSDIEQELEALVEADEVIASTCREIARVYRMLLLPVPPSEDRLRYLIELFRKRSSIDMESASAPKRGLSQLLEIRPLKLKIDTVNHSPTLSQTQNL